MGALRPVVNLGSWYHGAPFLEDVFDGTQLFYVHCTALSCLACGQGPSVPVFAVLPFVFNVEPEGEDGKGFFDHNPRQPVPLSFADVCSLSTILKGLLQLEVEVFEARSRG